MHRLISWPLRDGAGTQPGGSAGDGRGAPGPRAAVRASTQSIGTWGAVTARKMSEVEAFVDGTTPSIGSAALPGSSALESA